MRVRGFSAKVFEAKALFGMEGIGFGVEVEDGVAHTTIVMQGANGDALAARLDDDAIERMCDVFATIIEHGNGVLMNVGNDR